MEKNVEKQELGVFFGAISDPLHKQLEDQGFKYAKESVAHFEKDIAAINRLRIRGYLNDSQTDNVTQKLFRAIKRHVAHNNK